MRRFHLPPVRRQRRLSSLNCKTMGGWGCSTLSTASTPWKCDKGAETPAQHNLLQAVRSETVCMCVMCLFLKQSTGLQVMDFKERFLKTFDVY